MDVWKTTQVKKPQCETYAGVDNMMTFPGQIRQDVVRRDSIIENVITQRLVP